MLEYYHKNKTFLPKREGPLRDWMIDLVSILQKGDTLTKKKMAKIKETKIEKYLKPEVIYADDNAFSREWKKRNATSDTEMKEKKSKNFYEIIKSGVV